MSDKERVDKSKTIRFCKDCGKEIGEDYIKSRYNTKVNYFCNSKCLRKDKKMETKEINAKIEEHNLEIDMYLDELIDILLIASKEINDYFENPRSIEEEVLTTLNGLELPMTSSELSDLFNIREEAMITVLGTLYIAGFIKLNRDVTYQFKKK
jgi:YHS domain-containing protein